MNNSYKIQVALQKAILTQGSEQLAFITEALALAKEQQPKNTSVRNRLVLKATNDATRLAQISLDCLAKTDQAQEAKLRDMLTWPEVKGCAALTTRISRQLREFRK
jgi:hypothetical protein